MSAEQPPFGLSAARAAVFLDVDGTLLGFKDHPDDVVADPALRDLLVRLVTSTGGAVALVSGRTLADLDRIMAPLVLPAGGTHGAELRFADGRLESVSGEALDSVREAVEAIVAANPGTLLESKGAAVSIHYRLAPHREADIIARLRALALGDELMIQEGKLVAEIKSRAKSKGTAIDALMASPPFSGRVPVFIGDDLTDEYGFTAVNALDGVSIKVGPGETCAIHHLAAVEDVRRLLDGFCAAS